MGIKKLKPVDSIVAEISPQVVCGDLARSSMEWLIRTAVTSDRHTIYTALRAKLQEQQKEFAPADLVWEGDEEQEVGQWKFVPKENGLYCLNCERFTMEEGCTCGVVNIDFVLTLLDELFGVSK